MRFKEFFTEAPIPTVRLANPTEPVPPGQKKWGVDGKVVFAPANMTGDQVSAAIEANPAILDAPTTSTYISSSGLPSAKAPAQQPAGQGAKMSPPATTATPAQPADQPPPGYRFMTLANGNLVAVPQQLDDAKALELIKQKRPDLLGTVAKSPSSKKSVRVTIPADLQALPTADPKLAANAKKAADAYLGRVLSPQEWDHLLRATYAESGHSELEDAHIMATILNRARHGGFGGTNVSRVLTEPSQFQSVSGTSKQDPKSDPNFIQGPPAQSLTTMLQGAIKHLPKVPRDIGYFTSNKEAAYKAGTDKKFLKKLRDAGAKLVGDTIFAKMDPQGHIYKPQPPAQRPTTIAKK